MATTKDRCASTLKSRSAQVVGRDHEGSLVIRVTQTRGKKTAETDYGVWRLASDFGTAARWLKLENSGTSYDVLLDSDDGQCDCLGHLAHGHKTVCKHIALSRVLLERGELS